MERKWIELFSSCFLLHKREKWCLLIGSLGLKASRWMQSRQVASERTNQEVFVQAVVGCPVSSSSLSSCFLFATSSSSSQPGTTVSLLEYCCRQMLRSFIDSALLLSFFYVYDFFLRALVGGGLVVCVGQEQGGTGFRVLSSAFQQYSPLTFSLAVFVAATCFLWGYKKKVEDEN